MPVPKREPSIPVVARRPLADVVYDRITEDIIRGTLAAGERLHDEQLERRYGVSRATVRAALLRLTEVGLVESVPNLYTRVAPLDIDRFAWTLEASRILYLEAAQRGAASLTDEQLAVLESCVVDVGRLDRVPGEFVLSGRAAERFFRVFVDALGNQALDMAVRRMSPLLRRVLGHYAHLLPLEVNHLAVLAVEAAQSRDGVRTAAALADYFDAFESTFVTRLRALDDDAV